MSPSDSICARFEAVARGAYDRIALATPAREVTYGELLETSRGLARRLGELGRRPADRIAIAATDHAVVVPALLGVMRAGCVVVPIDATSDARMRGQLAAVGCRTIIVDRETRARLEPYGEVLELALTSAPEPAGPLHFDPDAACSIYFTSGSTGAPRGIIGRASGIGHHIAWELGHLALDASVRGAIVHAPSYDAYLPDVLVPLCAGGVACAPGALDPAALCAWLERERITLLHCVPSLFRGLLASPGAARLTRLRHVLLAGEVVRPSDVRGAHAILPAARLVNLYGPTEATLVKLHHAITAGDGERASVPIGVPMPGVQVHILDDAERPVAGGAIGQIAIQSAYGSHGYLDDPELTRARFRSAPDGSGEQLYLTGDYGCCLADGTFGFHGRRDRQIKLHGARVDLDEVEAILAACSDVVESAVVAREDTVLHGFVVLAETGSLARVRTHALRHLPAAARLAWLTPLAAMPRTASGKLDRRRMVQESE